MAPAGELTSISCRSMYFILFMLKRTITVMSLLILIWRH